jgi:mannose-6-phosphate isomerase-like protein (cupin superfamily)
MHIPQVVSRAQFQAEKMSKVDLASGEFLFAGLNCFLPGQTHAAHVHVGQDKLYVVMRGFGSATVGAEQFSVSAGDLVFAPSGVEHSMTNSDQENLVVMVIFAPKSSKKA